jgi:hypothetical protein
MDRFQQKGLGILDWVAPGQGLMGETIHPQVEHVPVIDDTLADLARFGAVPFQGLIAYATIF